LHAEKKINFSNNKIDQHQEFMSNVDSQVDLKLAITNFFTPINVTLRRRSSKKNLKKLKTVTPFRIGTYVMNVFTLESLHQLKAWKVLDLINQQIIEVALFAFAFCDRYNLFKPTAQLHLSFVTSLKQLSQPAFVPIATSNLLLNWLQVLPFKLIHTQLDTVFNDPMQLEEEPDNLVEIETIPDIVEVVNRVGRSRGPKPSLRPTQIPMETILEAVDALPTQTQGTKTRSSANGDATVTSTVEPS
jgi:hypothetical protein